MNFKKYNRLLGFLTGFCAFIVYFLTVEPTASYWDCAEYISTSAKLQIGHPPGAPLFQMLGAVFSILAFENTQIAYAINMMSVTSSALTIVFMFWSVSLLTKKILKAKSEISLEESFKIFGAAFLTTFTFMFTDSFWFNAVEAEVYAMATLILSVLFWLGLKWESEFENERSKKWLILISFVIGLSFGVHFMGLLAIPSIVLIYYYKRISSDDSTTLKKSFNEIETPKSSLKSNKWIENSKIVLLYNLFGIAPFFGKVTAPLLIATESIINKTESLLFNEKNKTTGFIIANIISVFILLFIFKLLLPLTLKIFGYLEVFFVNELGLPFNSGTIFSAILIIFILYTWIKYSREKNLYSVNTILLCITFIFIGFSSWMMIPIRSNAETVINENSPKDARSLLAYYNLEQYPDTYLFYGPMFSDAYAGQDAEQPYKDDKPKYERDETLNKYIIVNDWKNGKINSNSSHRGFFPRMWSSDNAENYMKYYGFLDFEIKREYRQNDQLNQIVSNFKDEINNNDVDADEMTQFFSNYASYLDIEKPGLMANLNYFISYQVVQMYVRYFMWNFSGRQNDNQWKYDNENGNWISGINIIDEYRIGSQENLPKDVLNNKARNKYYMIPLILGILGFVLVFRNDFKTFWPLFLLFVFTGIALKFYLNERVFEPRERDYALVGSFYAFSIFIGFSFIYIYNYLKKIFETKIASISTIVITILSPLLLAFNNWDDHDRSERYTAQSLAKAYLDSIDEDKQAIIFTIGDNDTFALWYAQEIEEHRTDVRTINTSLIATDWYMDQVKRRAYSSDPIKSKLKHKQYAHGIRDYIKYEPLIDSVRWDIKDFMNWISSDNERTKYKFLLQQYGYDQSDLKQVPAFTQNMVYYPTNKVRINVNKENVLKSGLVSENDKELIVDYIDIDLPESGLYKNQILMLDILSSNDWERPIYFTGGSYKDSEYLWMKDYLQLDGLVYKLVPIKTDLDPENPYQMGRIDPYRMYDIVKKWEWGNSNSDDIYHDPETRKNSITLRSNLHRLGNELIKIGDTKKALEILNLSFEKMPIDYFGYYSLSQPYIESYFTLNEDIKARNLFKHIYSKYFDQINYYSNAMNIDSNFDIESSAENIFTYNERLRSLIENQLIFETDISKTIPFITDYINVSESFKIIYGDYDFYTYLISFLESLYSHGEFESSRTLYNKIRNVISTRIDKLISAKNDENFSYVNSMANQELILFEQIIEIVSKYEVESSIKDKELKIFDSYNLEFK